MLTPILYRPAVLFISIWAVFCSYVAHAVCDKREAGSSDRPRIGLVLGGGGARGAAHVGVLKVLEELKIPIDCIAGNSMGAIVGGLYASGLSPEDIGREMTAMDWDDVMDDRPPRPHRQFRRKRDDDNYLVKKQLGFGDGKVKFPLGAIQGQKFDRELSRLTAPAAGVRDFDKLPIPFRAVATDVETGKAVELSSGNLARAIRASMAVPGAFDAVEINGKLLVDGLVANNVPVDVARDMGADTVIVVNVGTPLLKRDQITDVFAVISQMTGILSDRNVEAQLRTLRNQDIYIQVDLGDISTTDFKRAGEAIAIGEKAARAAHDKLAVLSSEPSEYRQYAAAHSAPVQKPRVVSFVRIDKETRIGEDVLARPFQPLIGKPIDYQTLSYSIEELYGWDIFESVRYEIVEENGNQGLLVHVKEKNWGPNYLQLGLALSTDFDGEGKWNFGASVLKTALNRRAGEMRFSAQIGEEPAVGAELYQPLDVDLRYFINPRAFFDTRDISRFEGDDQVEEFRVTRYGGELSAGRLFGRCCEARVGLRRYTGDAEVHVGDPAAPDIDFDNAEAYLRLYYDTLDNRNFPRDGVSAGWEWIESIEALGADDDFSQSVLSAGLAHTWGRHTLVGNFVFNYTAAGEAPVQNRFRSGGFLNFSGFVQDQLSGQQEMLLRGVYFRRIGDIQWLPAYAGLSLEYGNVYEDRDDISLSPDDALLAASVFLGLDTVLGPLYLSYGHAEQGHDGVYLFLGRLF